MKSRPAVWLSAGCIIVISTAVCVLAALGADQGYEWYSARCGTTLAVYPELGWLFFVMPLSAGGAICGAAALWLELKRHPPETWFPLMLLAVAILLGGGAAALSAIQLLDPCGTGG